MGGGGGSSPLSLALVKSPNSSEEKGRRMRSRCRCLGLGSIWPEEEMCRVTLVLSDVLFHLANIPFSACEKIYNRHAD